ncbi:amidohydrolase family protein [Methylocaldum sp.]|uniref:amidohydrolase family protein n=1 Tax=Methylocaldum sp. TaxID=1969727 RepID=UPI002D2F2FAA|nr:amidohydrolase family protein [Methylocaldum sp.]HYE37042.1 amidohydrolase family protein [Methylocaldum sp.]
MISRSVSRSGLQQNLLLTMLLLVGMIGTPLAQTKAAATTRGSNSLILKAARVFDGVDLNHDYTVLIVDGKVASLGPSKQVQRKEAPIIDLGDATLLPGFIELHGHLAFRNVPRDTVLRHGVTTVRDVGGPLLAPSGGEGSLRLLTAGPIITGPGGYPIPVFGNSGHGHGDVAAPVETPEQARQLVQNLVAGGAAIIKIALEPGGEPGASWSTGHAASIPPPWPMPSLEIARAVVDEAHRLGKQVSAHVAEPKGVARALAAGVDEWAHVPCEPISDKLLGKAVQQGVRILTTLDTLSHCPGIRPNVSKLASLGAHLFYGAEIAHTEIPWGIDAEELHLMVHLTGMTPLDVFRTATSKAGEVLGLAPLGTLSAGAPADLIAVRGDAFKNFKPLESPDLVMSGGRIIVDYFTH